MININFKGKSVIANHHLSVPHHMLKTDVGKSLLNKCENPSLHDNIIIHGDNFLALKALLPTHGGKINCTYIEIEKNQRLSDSGGQLGGGDA